jgi:hypothetical protein
VKGEEFFRWRGGSALQEYSLRITGPQQRQWTMCLCFLGAHLEALHGALPSLMVHVNKFPTNHTSSNMSPFLYKIWYLNVKKHPLNDQIFILIVEITKTVNKSLLYLFFARIHCTLYVAAPFTLSVARAATLKSKKGRNFTTEEQYQMCKSFLHVSQDPIMENGQKKDVV